ncbi:LysE family transporter [Candidatus Babeliales bacterium]|nr:LysE family transporter [Candidatus Babeliales bacterium]
MEISFLLKCFFVGVLAASGCGPIFVLTFNRSAVCGFFKGLATAVGASFGDAIYFSLGLLGALTVVGELKYFMFFLDLIGGIVLIALGWHAIKKMQQLVCVTVECSYGVVFSATKALTLTLLNPLIIFYFMAISVQVLPDNMVQLSFRQILASSFFVFAGSLSVLSLVSLLASYLGSCLSARRHKIFSGVTGVIFLIFGAYLFFDFLRQLLSFVR